MQYKIAVIIPTLSEVLKSKAQYTSQAKIVRCCFAGLIRPFVLFKRPVLHVVIILEVSGAYLVD